MSDKRWYEIYDAYFRKLNKREIQIWEDELSERFNDNYSEDEVIRAIKNLAEMKRKGRIEWAIGCNEIITQIIKERYEAKKARGDVQTEKCGLCHGGWLSYIVSFNGDQREIGAKKHYTDNWYLMEEVCPCLCSVGEKAMQKIYQPELFEEVKNTSREVMEWINSINDQNDPEELRFGRKRNLTGK